MAIDTLHTAQLEIRFKSQKILDTKDFAAFYKTFDAEIQPTTINWRLHTLVKTGFLNRVGRGRYCLGERRSYHPPISSGMKTVFSKLKRQFPYLKMCIWDTSALNEFMLHQPGRLYLIVEVEKEAAESTFYFLKDSKYSVYISPTRDLIEKYFPSEKEIVIVQPLITEAPVQILNGVDTVSLEKMLVDVFCDPVVFSSQQGAEMRTIFLEALTKYSVNRNKMLRYADRRRKKASFSQYLNTITD